MFYIKEGFKNYRNEVYDNIREVHLDTMSDTSNLGKFILETHKEDSDKGFKFNDGIYLYGALNDPTKAYRIYKDFADYKYVFYSDDKFISELQKRQQNIKLTKFPTGVVTLGGKVIGQEIPYYQNCLSISSYLKDKKNKKTVIHYYIEILNIIKELYLNGIIYKDVNSGNFLINTNTEEINLIDFDSTYTNFSTKKDSSYELMINHLKKLINELNSINNIKFKTDLDPLQTLEEIEDCIIENHNKLIK